MKAHILTLGCKVNQFESTAMRESLERAGYDSSSEGPYDLIVINACVVTHRAEKEAMRLFRQLKKENPEAKIIVAGCLAEASPDKLVSEGADLLLGNTEKEGILSYLDEPKGSVFLGRRPEKESLPLKGSPLPIRTRALLKIQDGCDASCSYCVVPKLRGKSVSAPKELIVKALGDYREKGYGEVVLTGIHLGHWGKDLSPKEDVATLLHAVQKELKPDPDSFRIRLSSLEPSEAGLLLPLIGEYPWLAPHLHIPLQAGCDKVLRAMNRPYKSSFFEKLTVSFKKRYPNMSLGSDVLTGFPGETELDFNNGLDFIKSIPINYLHIFPFSPRTGTRAEGMGGKVSEIRKKERALLLKEVDRGKREKFIMENVGRKERAIVENTHDPKSRRQKVLTGNYLSALLIGSYPEFYGKLIKVTMEAPANPYGKPEARVSE
jgi:threonylcarbamoyladenosine tRNA methylthiotransferase MtaB